MSHTIFKNAMLLDAEGGALIGPCNVLVDGGLVAYITTGPIRRKGAAVHDIKGKTLMPGLCDAQVQTSRAVIRSATVNAAELFGLQGQIGLVEEGAQADLLVLDGNPLDDLTLLQHQGKHMLAIMKGGVFYKNELG